MYLSLVSKVRIMDYKQLLRCNKLIAEFDGYKFNEDDMLNGIFGVYTKNGKLPLSQHELNYHNEWNWLMPIVEKIEDLADRVVIENCYCSIISGKLGEVNSFWKHCRADSKIQATYPVIVEFIKWYNQNK